MKRAICGGVLALSALILSAEDAPAKKDPAPASEDVMQFPSVSLNLKVSDMDPAVALKWVLQLADSPLAVESTKKASAKKVSFELIDVSLEEALQTVSQATGAEYRTTEKTIRLATADEWKEIDAGTKTFDELAK